MSFKITFDPNKCQGSANCIIEAPKLFDFDEDRNIAILMAAGESASLDLQVAHPDDDLRQQAEASQRGCPAHAILVEDE